MALSRVKTMKNFKQLHAWQNGFYLAVQSFKLVNSFPKVEWFGLGHQITKAAVLSLPT